LRSAQGYENEGLIFAFFFFCKQWKKGWTVFGATESVARLERATSSWDDRNGLDGELQTTWQRSICQMSLYFFL
jgi:hypothetical protein